MKTKKIIIMQVISLAVVVIVLYFLYPKANLDVERNSVNFKSINANVIIFSENPDFSNPKYIEIREKKSLSFNLEPGTYYWKASNNFIEGLQKSFTIPSEVGLGINEEPESENAELVNIGNVKVNVTKSKEGVMVGYIILEPNESEKAEPAEYTGRQE